MPRFTPPVRDTGFVLEHVVGLYRHADFPGLDHVTPETVEAVLEQGGRMAAEVLFPLNQVGDRHGCVRAADGTVTTAPGFKQAYAAFVADGWAGLAGSPTFGGQGMPYVVAKAFGEYLVSANMAFAVYAGLTQGAAALLAAKGSPSQQATYLAKLVSGEWGGAMSLTEPQCGTDLRLIRTRAEPQADGSYRITGSKIFVSAGDHDLTDNIVHLVLARTPDAPASAKGLSLFLVPKRLVEEDGSVGPRNAMCCTAIESKMGLHGSATCAIAYHGATGWLVGEEMKGLGAMFIMINTSRLSVGMQGLGIAEVAYQNAVRYARNRRQGRALTGPAEPDESADTLLVHPDVRRMLMEGKALTEGLRALSLWGAFQLDLSRHSPDPRERERAQDLLDLLTPVIKGYATDMGFKVATDAQQVFGGHGYIRDTGMEQHVRDARITQIYEGANGVQAMDLVRRKLVGGGGRAMAAFCALVEDEADGAREEMSGLAGQLRAALGDLRAANGWLEANRATMPDHVGAGAVPFLHLLGTVATGLMWLRMGNAAARLLQQQRADTGFLQAKLVTARFFGERFLPDTTALRRRIESGSDAIMALAPEMFGAA